MKAFMDDTTVISESKRQMEKLLKRLQELFKWAVLKIRSTKSRNLSIIKGRCQEIKFAIDHNVIREKSEQVTVDVIPFHLLIVISSRIF